MMAEYTLHFLGPTGVNASSVDCTAISHTVPDEAIRCRARPTTSSRERAHHADMPRIRKASTSPYGMLAEAPMRCANVPTMPHRMPATTVTSPRSTGLSR